MVLKILAKNYMFFGQSPITYTPLIQRRAHGYQAYCQHPSLFED